LATVSSYCALNCMTVARRNPASNRDSAAAGPIEKKRLGHVNHFANEVLSSPAAALNVTVGKYAALAMPICALACATRRSAAAMSGRRSRSWDGTPMGIAGGLDLSGSMGIENVDAGWPVSMAMACS